MNMMMMCHWRGWWVERLMLLPGVFDHDPLLTDSMYEVYVCREHAVSINCTSSGVEVVSRSTCTSSGVAKLRRGVMPRSKFTSWG